MRGFAGYLYSLRVKVSFSLRDIYRYPHRNGPAKPRQPRKSGPMTITVDVSKAVGDLSAKLGAFANRQVPYAAALALTRTAQDAQQAELREMRDVFDRPTPWTMSGTYVRPATRTNLQASVGLKDFAGKGIPAATFLAPQIAGGARRLKRFESALKAAGHLPDDFRVVPGSGAQLDAYGNIKPSQIVEILSYLRAFPEAGYRANMTDRRRQRLARGSKTKQGFTYFIGRPGDRGPLGVWKRYAFARGTAVRPILIFVRQAYYRAVFDFEYVATTTATRAFPVQFETALAEAMRTAR